MIVGIILIICFGIGIIILKRDEDNILGLISVIFSAIFLIMHISLIYTTEFSYEKLKVEKIAFQRTLENSRLYGGKYESAAIINEIVVWNVNLATIQFNNTVWFFDPYIDDRINSIKPIE